MCQSKQQTGRPNVADPPSMAPSTIHGSDGHPEEVKNGKRGVKRKWTEEDDKFDIKEGIPLKRRKLSVDEEAPSLNYGEVWSNPLLVEEHSCNNGIEEVEENIPLLEEVEPNPQVILNSLKSQLRKYIPCLHRRVLIRTNSIHLQAQIERESQSNLDVPQSPQFQYPAPYPAQYPAQDPAQYPAQDPAPYQDQYPAPYQYQYPAPYQYQCPAPYQYQYRAPYQDQCQDQYQDQYDHGPPLSDLYPNHEYYPAQQAPSTSNPESLVGDHSQLQPSIDSPHSWTPALDSLPELTVDDIIRNIQVAVAAASQQYPMDQAPLYDHSQPQPSIDSPHSWTPDLDSLPEPTVGDLIRSIEVAVAAASQQSPMDQAPLYEEMENSQGILLF